MNLAALKANVSDLRKWHGDRQLRRVHQTQPLVIRRLPTGESGSSSGFVVHAVLMTTLTRARWSRSSLEEGRRRAKNMFALGLLCWMYGRPIGTSETFIREKFIRKPQIAEANVLALRAAGTTARPPRRSPPPTRWPRSWRRGVSPDLGNTAPLRNRRRRPARRRPGGPRELPITRRRTSCTSRPSTRTSTC